MADLDKQRWGETAKSYSVDVNRATLPAVEQLVSMATSLQDIDKDSRILDVGAGAGAVTKAIAARSPSANITAIDTSRGMLDTITVPSSVQLETKVLDAMELSKALPANYYSHVFCTFVLHVVHDPRKVLEEIRKVSAPDAVVAIALWGTRMDVATTWEKACQSIDPSYKAPVRLLWPTAGETRSNLTSAGFNVRSTDEKVLPFPFDTAEDWAAFHFRSHHPVQEALSKSWNGSMEEAEKALIKVTREQYGDGKDMSVSAVLAACQ